jgi:hypothetical protein
MRIPRREPALIRFVQDRIAECRVTVDQRRQASMFYRNLFFTGEVEGGGSPVHNKCFSHVEKLASQLFSPSEVRLKIDFEGDDSDDWAPKVSSAERRINREFANRRIGDAFSSAVLFGLIDSCCFIKPTWTRNGVKPNVIFQHLMGVQREDEADLDDQDCFTHSFYLTRPALRRLLNNNPDRTELMDKTRASFQPASEDIQMDSFFMEMVMGGQQPQTITGTPSGQTGTVLWNNRPPYPQLSTDVLSDLVRVDDLWVMDDDRGDWMTIRYVEPGIILEGNARRRNLSDAPGQLPFVKVCPNELPGYFWGRSELQNLVSLQGKLNARINDVDHTLRLQAKPPKVFSGYSGINQEKAMVLLTAGGAFCEAETGASGKVTPMAPEMPSEALAWIANIERWFDEMGGFTPAMNGQGDPAVRAGNQLQSLQRAGSPRLRDRAFLVEGQCSRVGDITLDILQAKDAHVLLAEGGGQFFLKQLPEDSMCTVDSHTSSPIFSSDNTNLAFAYRKVGAIDNNDLIDMTHPPNADRLIRSNKKREKERAEFIKAHPELLQGKKPGPKSGGMSM